MTSPHLAAVAATAEKYNPQRQDLPDLLGEVLDTAIALTEADFGNIQMLDPAGHLRIVAQRGFPDWWIAYWNTAAAGQGACGAALAQDERLVIEDVEQSPIFAGTPALDIQLKAGVRAVHAFPLRNHSDQVLGMLSIHYRTPYRPDAKASRVLDMLAAHAVTLIEHARATQALENASNLLAEAQKIAHQGSFEYDVATGTTLWSEEQYRIHGLDPAGQPPTLEEIVTRYTFPEDRDWLHQRCLAAVQSQREFDQEHRIVLSDGSARWVLTRARPYFDAQGKLLRYIGTTLDITERKRREAAHKHNEMMQSLARQQVATQTAAALAHELNQPLAALASYSEVALHALDGGQEKAGQLARAIEGGHAQALRAGQVLHQLIGHLHKGHQGETGPQPFDLNTLVREVIDKVRELEFRNINATLNFEPAMPPVLGHRLQTEKVLLNLIQNGCEAMEEASVSSASFVVAVRTQTGRNMAHVTVRDSGPGLDAESARRIFDPFFSTKPNGLGLGLVISRSLIEAQGGQLWLDPEDGPGAVFHFTLPLAHE